MGEREHTAFGHNFGTLLWRQYQIAVIQIAFACGIEKQFIGHIGSTGFEQVFNQLRLSVVWEELQV